MGIILALGARFGLAEQLLVATDSKSVRVPLTVYPGLEEMGFEPTYTRYADCNAPSL